MSGPILLGAPAGWAALVVGHAVGAAGEGTPYWQSVLLVLIPPLLVGLFGLVAREVGVRHRARKEADSPPQDQDQDTARLLDDLARVRDDNRQLRAQLALRDTQAAQRSDLGTVQASERQALTDHDQETP